MKLMDYLNKQDWDAAIAECTREIDGSTKTGNSPSYDVYMNRGYARCFVPPKDGNYEKAIEDLSKAVTLAPDKQKIECLVKRAYAYWISGRYDCAVADCKEAVKNKDDGKAQEAADKLKETADKAPKGTGNIVQYKKFAHELLGNIYAALDNPLEALEHYKKALSETPGSPSLLDNYRKVSERLNRSR
jgi:tetratricopeptide (TPR) repeat protein